MIHNLAFALIGAPIGALLVSSRSALSKGDTITGGWHLILSLGAMAGCAILIFKL